MNDLVSLLGSAYASVPHLCLKAFPHAVTMLGLINVHKPASRMSAEANEQVRDRTTDLREISE